MLAIAPLLLGFAPPTAEAVEKRYADWANRTPSFAVSMTGGRGGPALVNGELRVQRPNRIFFSLNGGGERYRMTSIPGVYMEWDETERYYTRLAEEGVQGPYPTLFSGIRDLFYPGALTLTSLTRLHVPNAPKRVTQYTIDGQPVDVVTSERQGVGGGRMAFSVDRQGRLRRIDQVVVVDGAEIKTVFNFSNYRALPPNPFPSVIPDGFVPYVNDSVGSNPDIGSRIRFGTWNTPRGSVNVDGLIGAGPTLVAVIDAGGPSSRAEASLRRLQDGGLRVVRLSADASLGRRSDVTVDPSGRGLRQLNPPGRPFFALIKAGTLEKAWLGYVPARAAAWEKEVRDNAR